MTENYDLDYAADKELDEEEDDRDLVSCAECGTLIDSHEAFMKTYDDPAVEEDYYCDGCVRELGFVAPPVVVAWENASGAAPILGSDKQLVPYEGMWFDEETPRDVMVALVRAHEEGWRVKLHYGDKTTGADWREFFGTMGYVGKTTGSLPIPLLVFNSRCHGGCAITTSNVVKISTTGVDRRGARVWKRNLFCHPKYHVPPEPVYVDELSGRLMALMTQLQVQTNG